MAGYFVVLAVAIATEAPGWTIVIGNICLNALMYRLPHVPSIKSALTFTFLFQAAKSDFL